MTSTNSKQLSRDLAAAIIDFLNTSIHDGSVTGDEDAVQVAIECLSDAFGVKLEDKTAALGPHDTLLSVFAKYKKEQASKKHTISSEIKAHAEALKLEGNRAVASRSYRQAVEYYTQAIGLNPYDPVFLSNRAAAFSSMRDFENAIADAKAALEIDPSFTKAYSRLGFAYYSAGDAKASLSAYEKGLELEGDSPSSAMMKGYEAAKKLVEQEMEHATTSDDGSTVTPEPEQVTKSATSADGSSKATAMGDDVSVEATNGFASATSRSTDGPASTSASSSTSQNDAATTAGHSAFSDLGGFLNNPHFANIAQTVMSNPSAIAGIQQMASNLQTNGMPSMADVLNNPALQELARNFMGASSNASAGTNPSSNANANSNPPQ